MSTMTTNTMPQTQPKSGLFTLRRASIALTIIGMLVTGYLSYNKLFAAPLVCVEGGMFNCDVVINSRWSYLLGIPVAYLGFMIHFVPFMLLMFESRVRFLQNYNTVLIFGILLFGFIYHCYLTYISVFVLRALCQWCLAAHLTVGIHLIIATNRLLRSMKDTATAAAA